jgi:hypothetical protein
MVVSGGVAVVSTVVVTTQATIQIVGALRRRTAKLRARRENIEALFGVLQDADFTTGNVPPDDVDSLKLFKSWLCRYFRRDRRIEYSRQLGLADTTKHLCSVGGPVDHLFTRYGMGYDKEGANWRPLLPFIYPLREAEARGATIVREWKGERWGEIAWYIADRHGKAQFVPTTDTDGVLDKDYFMLIIAPNTLTREAFYKGQKHIMIAPAHGLAQLAVKDILDSDSILSELMNVRKQSEYLQAIVEVPAKRTKHGYAPRGKLNLLAAVPLDAGEFEKAEDYRGWS